MPDDDKDQPKHLTPEVVAGALLLLIRFASAPSRLLLVKPGTMGRRAMGAIELLGACLFLSVAASVLGIEKGVQWVMPFSGFLCLCWALQKLKSYGSKEIEGYIGTTWMSTRFPRSQGVQVMGEACVWLLALALYGNLCPPIALAMVVSGVASAFYVGLILEREKREIQLMVDEKRRQEIMAERFRQMSGE